MDLMERTSTTPHVLALALVMPANDHPQPHTSASAQGKSGRVKSSPSAVQQKS
jgi:hypothetical protein